MAKPKKGVVPAHLKAHLFKAKSGGAKKGKAMPAFLAKKLGRKSRGK